MDPIIARKTWRTVEPVHGLVYLTAEAARAYDDVGLDAQSGYFASRSAPMGRVSPEVVVATFFNFSPVLVRAAMDGVWDRADPGEVVQARLRLIDTALQRVLGAQLDEPGVGEAAALLRAAAESACRHPAGRPIFAAYATLDWPTDPHLVLWHAQTLLREFRGDGHVAALTVAGVSGCEALVLHAATGEVPRPLLQATRFWTDAEWDAAVASLVARGWVDESGAFTDAGRAARAAVEQHTDELAVVAYETIGDDACARVRELVRPLSRAIAASGELGPMSAARGSAATDPS
jgi:hypothetical protein